MSEVDRQGEGTMMTGLTNPSWGKHVVSLAWLALVIGTMAPAMATQTVTYYATNAQGTVVATMDSQGNPTYTAAYRPYGKQAQGTPQVGPGYTGHVNDPDTGLVYMQQRYYDPDVGRFISPDPIAPTPGNIFNFGRYTYANNNPLRFTDPNGEATVYKWPNGDVIIVQTFVNKSTMFTDQQIESEAGSFAGTTSTGNKVTVVFVPSGAQDKDAVVISVDPKLDDTSPNGADRSHVNKNGGRKIKLAPNAAGKSTVGHELGHVLGAGDQYKNGIGADGKVLKKSVPGDPNIMKTSGYNNANQQTINEIYNGINQPNNKIMHCNLQNKDGAVCQ